MFKQRLGTIVTLGALLLSVLVVIVPSVSADAYFEGFEGCEQFDIPDQGSCSNSLYNYAIAGTGSGTVSTSQAHTGTKSYKITNNAGSDFNGHFASQGTTFIRCDTATSLLSADWWIYFTNLPTTGNYEFGLANAANNFDGATNGIWFAVDSAGLVTPVYDTDVGTTALGGLFTVTTGVWYHFLAGCSVAGSTATLLWREITGEYSIQTTAATTVLDAQPLFNHLSFDIDSNAAVKQYFVDDIIYIDAAEGVSVISATDTVAVTGLTGFDTLENGGHVIARTNSGDFIRTYTGETLVNLYSEDTNCSNNNGVVALEDQGFGYFICDGGDIDHIKFIDVNGVEFPWANCLESGCPDIDGQIDLGTELGGGAEENGFNDLVDLSDGEIVTFESDDFRRHSFIIGATSSLDGRYYVFTTNFVEHDGTDGTESAYEQHVTFSPTAADDICSNHLLRAYVVGDDSSTKGYEVTTTSLGNLNPITNPFTGSTNINTADTIACSQFESGDVGKILVGETQGADTVVFYNVQTSSTVWTITPVAPALEVALSEDGLWGMYSTSTTSYLINATSGEVTCQLTHPAGTFVDNDLDELGQRAWVATDVNIAYYAIQEGGCTTEEPESEGGGSSTSTTSGTTTSGGCLGCTAVPSTGPGSRPFGIDINYVAEGLNISAVGVQVLIGLILCVIFAIWLYRGTGSIIAAFMGVGLGLAVATVIGLVPPWVVMAIVLGLLIILGKMLFGAFTGGEEA